MEEPVEALKKRTLAYGLRAIRLVSALPNDPTAKHLGNQLMRSATSVGANYRAAQRAKSRAHLISKMGDVEEECDESLYWMELLEQSGIMKPALLSSLKTEGNELLAIAVATITTAKRNRS